VKRRTGLITRLLVGCSGLRLMGFEAAFFIQGHAGVDDLHVRFHALLVNDKLTVKCSGEISAAVEDVKSTKEVAFTVQQSSDGNTSVSVDPFKFSGVKTDAHQED
jgi:hypothetical protein